MQKTICQRIFQECSGVSHGSPISLRTGLSTSCVVRMKYHTEESRELLAILIINSKNNYKENINKSW